MWRPFVVDRKGDEIDLDDLMVMGDIRGRLSHRQALEYLASNVGLIVIEPHHSHMTIYLRAKQVSGPALAALYRCLAERSPERVDLRCFKDGGWSAHVFGMAVVEFHLEQLLADSDGGLADRIRRRPIAVAALERSHPFLPLLELWQEGGKAADIEFWRPILAREGLNSFQWTRPDPQTHQLKIVEYGAGMPACAQRWLAHASRLSLDDHPDRHYAAYCRDTYWRAAMEGTPRIETLDLFVEWPTFGLVRRTFHRALLRVEAPEGDVLLGATLFDPAINLRERPGERDLEIVE